MDTTASNQDTDDEPRGYHLQLFSIHGLIRGHQLELGRDADTGGQTKYVVELARALATRPEVRQVDLFTRRLEDRRLSDDYAVEIEPIGEGARIVRIAAGGRGYRRKELLWPVLDEFVDNVLKFNRDRGILPDVVHGHYADGGYVAKELAAYLGVPLVFTGHSLGRNKRKVLSESGVDATEMEARYMLSHRIEVEEELLRKADLVIASTSHETERGYEGYRASPGTAFKVIPPGIDVDRFYPYFYDLDTGHDPGETVVRARVRMEREIGRFLNDPDRPLILAISRPDRRKNIEGLVRAYGEDPALQQIANLAVFAGVRGDIGDMDDNEREVLTELLLLMDRFDLYGKLALPKKHDPDADIPVLYRLAAARRGVFVNPALVENFGITLIEASSSGLPIVSTDHGGPQDIVRNCRSGVLVDAKDTEAIRAALHDVLLDADAWDERSQAGIEGVRRHYAWDAHSRSYLAALDDLDASPPDEEDAWRGTVGRSLPQRRRLLISDIDNTLIDDTGAGDPEALAELIDRLEAAEIGFGVATGRSIELVEAAIADHGLPRPEIVICDVGSQIYYGPEKLPDRGYSAHISYRWKPSLIHDTLADIEGLELQGGDTQRHHKISYFLEGGAERLETIRAALDEVRARHTMIFSHGNFLDILPYRASKGKAVRYLSNKWGVDPQQIAVAGDSGNDEEMLRGPLPGIVVGNHTSELDRLRGESNIYFAKAGYARGVIEGLEHYGFLESRAATLRAARP